MANLNITQLQGRVVLDVKVVAGSSRTAIAGTMDGMLKVKISVAPEKGKANRCLIDFLAKKLGIKKKALRIISGKTSPIKQLEIRDVSVEDVLAVVNCD